MRPARALRVPSRESQGSLRVASGWLRGAYRLATRWPEGGLRVASVWPGTLFRPFHREQRRLRQGSWLDRGCESHPPNWAVHGGTRPQQRRREAGLDAEGDEQTGRNESEPHIMSLDISQTGDKPSPSSLGEGRWGRVGQQPASAQRSGGVCVDSTSGRQARITWEDSGDGR